MKKLFTPSNFGYVAILFIAIFTLSSAKYKTIKRDLDSCNKNSMCTSTLKELCTFTTDDGPITGWCVTCSGRGQNKCPKSIDFHTGSDLDPIDVSQSNLLIDYAINQVESLNLVGNHTIQVSVSGEIDLRTYIVNWDYTVTEFTESGTMEVERLQ